MATAALDYLLLSEEAQSILAHAALSFCFCFTLFVSSWLISPLLFPQTFSKLPEERKIEWHCTFVSILPTLIVPPGAFLSYREFDYSPSEILTTNSSYLPAATGLSVGYMFFDFVVMMAFPRLLIKAFGIPTFILFCIHHIFSFCIWPWGILANRGALFINWYLITELTNIFMHIHWFLTKFEMESSITFKINAAFWIGSFFIVRILPIPPLLYVMIASSWKRWSSVEFWVGIFTIPIPMGLNSWWFFLIVYGVAQFLRTEQAKPNTESLKKQEF